MRAPRFLRRVLPAAAVAALLAGCAASARPLVAASATSATSATAATSPVLAAAPTALDRTVVFGKVQYAREVSGGKARSLLHRVARDPAFLAALQTSDAAARAYVAQQFPSVWYHWHVSRVRVVRGSTVVVERGVPFVVDGPRTVLRDAHGRRLGTLQISIQDEIGFVRLLHRHHGVDVVVRSANDVRSSLPAATRVTLPARGTVSVAGRRYAVRSFKESAFNGAPVTIWFLARTP